MKNEVIALLNKLSHEINNHYGYVKVKGPNFGEPVINSGPCGPLANAFFFEWNRRFDEKVIISFVMEIFNNDCYHVLIRLPNGKFYDGGIGVHDEGIYDSQFKIEDMKVYDLGLLDKRSCGLGREYPQFCPNFKISEVEWLIEQYLNEACK